MQDLMMDTIHVASEVFSPLPNSSPTTFAQTETQKLAEQAVRAIETDTIPELDGGTSTMSNHIEDQEIAGSEPLSEVFMEDANPIPPQLLNHTEDSHCSSDPTADFTVPFIPLLPSAPAPLRGDLTVILSKTDSSYNYRVHGDCLRRPSVKLSDTLEKASQAHASHNDGTLQYLLAVGDGVDGKVPKLTAYPMSNLAGFCQAQIEESSLLCSEPLIKLEPGTKMSAVSQDVARQRLLYAQAYRAMMIIMHGSWQDVDSFVSLPETAHLVEAIASVAAIYDVLPFTRVHLRSLFNDHGDDVFSAIKEDPPRWLSLSIQLQDFWWFREAMIHIIGAFPELPAGWSDFHKYPIPTKVQEVIEQKSRRLKTAVQNLIIDLQNSDLVDDKGKILAFRERYEEWVAVHQWREWLSSELRSTRGVSGTTAYVVPEKVGPLICKLREGMHGCFSIDEKLKELPRDPNHHWTGYREHMQMMAAYAQKAVRTSGLANSKLKLKIKSKGPSLDYLTCVEVDKKDVPWKLR